jgi:hypothetical protein
VEKELTPKCSAFIIFGQCKRTLKQKKKKGKEMLEIDNSYFDGGLLQLIGYHILGSVITTLTLGICLPWAYCLIYEWEAKHTVIEGRRLCFDGSAVQLFGNWIKWFFLTIITLGIYGFWVQIKLKQWRTAHTHFA